MVMNAKGFILCIYNPIIISNTEKNIKLKLQFFVKMMTADDRRILLSDPPTSRISTCCNQDICTHNVIRIMVLLCREIGCYKESEFELIT